MAVRGTSHKRGEERVVSPPPRCVESVAPWTGAKPRHRRTGGSDHLQPRAAGLSPDRFPAESSRSCPRRAPAQNARRESSPSHRPNQGGECAHETRYAQSGSPLLSEPPLWMASVSLVISIPYWQLYPKQACPLRALVTRPCEFTHVGIGKQVVVGDVAVQNQLHSRICAPIARRGLL